MNQALLSAAQSVWPSKVQPPLDMGVEDGIVWAICISPMGNVNGYAMIPAEGHCWSNGATGADEALKVHGGITYHRHPWLGFDTAHGGDVWDVEYDRHGIFQPHGDCLDRRWTVDLVREEAKSLARQLAAITDIDPERVEK